MVIAGVGRMGQIVARVLRAQRVPFIALDTSVETIELTRTLGAIPIFYGDPMRPEILRAAQVEKAEFFVIATDDPETNIETAKRVRKLYPHLKIIARARNRQHVHLLLDAGVEPVRETFFSSLEMSRMVLCGLGLSEEQADARIRRFRRHDEEVLASQHLFYNDRDALIKSAREARVELETLFQTDQLEDRGAVAAETPEKPSRASWRPTHAGTPAWVIPPGSILCGYRSTKVGIPARHPLCRVEGISPADGWTLPPIEEPYACRTPGRTHRRRRIVRRRRRHLMKHCPGKSFALLEGRAAMGGTWDLFRYPGIRSDSDMFTLGYNFKPWSDPKAIADGPSIRRYIEETARENGIDRKIRYRHRVLRADWDSANARWNLDVQRGDEPEPLRMTAQFLLMCTGYYRYEAGYTRNSSVARTSPGRSSIRSCGPGPRLQRQEGGGDR